MHIYLLSTVSSVHATAFAKKFVESSSSREGGKLGSRHQPSGRSGHEKVSHILPSFSQAKATFEGLVFEGCDFFLRGQKGLLTKRVSTSAEGSNFVPGASPLLSNEGCVPLPTLSAPGHLPCD